jgi:hypothetical protein
LLVEEAAVLINDALGTADVLVGGVLLPPVFQVTYGTKKIQDFDMYAIVNLINVSVMLTYIFLSDQCKGCVQKTTISA